MNLGARARPPFNVAWSKRVPRNGYLEAPAVVDDGVLVYASYGKRFGSDLFARDAMTGRRLWHKHYRNGANFAGSAGIFRGRVYITSHDGNIRCYGLRSGKIKFRKKIAAAESPPIGAGNLVYFGDGPRGGNGRFRAVNWRTGRTRWSYKASGTISSGAALTATTAYFASYGGSVYALNRFTGKLRWKTTVRGARNNLVPFYSTPALARGRLIVGGTDGSIYALDPRDGSQRWRYDGNGYVYGSAAIWHGRVFIGDFGGGFHAISLKSGRRLWKRNIGPIIGSATVMRGLVYISSLRPPRTYAFDARTGRQVWSFGDGQFSPLIADGKQVWLTGKAHVYRLAERESKAARRAKAAARGQAEGEGEGQGQGQGEDLPHELGPVPRPRRARGVVDGGGPRRQPGAVAGLAHPARHAGRAERRSARWPPAWCWSTWRACWSTRARAGASSPRRTSGAPSCAAPWRSTSGSGLAATAAIAALAGPITLDLRRRGRPGRHPRPEPRRRPLRRRHHAARPAPEATCSSRAFAGANDRWPPRCPAWSGSPPGCAGAGVWALVARQLALDGAAVPDRVGRWPGARARARAEVERRRVSLRQAGWAGLLHARVRPTSSRSTPTSSSSGTSTRRRAWASTRLPSRSPSRP